jgi:hypothetical protein
VTHPDPHGRIPAQEQENQASRPVMPGDDAGWEFVYDAEYYKLVRLTLGRGAPGVLLGTSNKSLDRAVHNLEAALQGAPDVANASRERSERRILMSVLLSLTFCFVIIGTLASALLWGWNSNISAFGWVISTTAVLPVVLLESTHVLLTRKTVREKIHKASGWNDNQD